jgi:hypothetical protein
MINSPGTYDVASVRLESLTLCIGGVALAMVIVSKDPARNVMASIKTQFFLITILP